MSLEKTAIVTGPPIVPAKVRFYYEIERLFNSASMRTNLRANVIKDEKTGETQEDIYAINESERNALTDFMSIGIKKIASKVLRVLAGFTDPVFIETTFTPAGASTAIIASGVIILDNAKYVNDVLNAIDNEFENALRYYILEQWYIFCAMEKDAALNQLLHSNSIKELSKLMLQLRKPLAS